MYFNIIYFDKINMELDVTVLFKNTKFSDVF